MYSTFFVNNKTYGADDINKVFAHLTTQGVSLFNDTGDALMDLDTAMANLVTEGVQAYDYGGCKVVSVGNGYYKISKGCYWMPSGACVIFDDEGYVFELNFLDGTGTKGTTCYVYLRQGGAESDGVSNEINIIVSGEAPADTDSLLATISSVGAITDKRKIAVSKLSVPAVDPTVKCTVTLTTNTSIKSLYMAQEKPNSNYDYVSSGPVLLDCEFSNYGYIYVKYGDTAELVKLTNKWQRLCYLTGDNASWFVARKTENGIEVAFEYTRRAITSRNTTFQLFLGEVL